MTQRNQKSVTEGTDAEKHFISLRGSNFIRKSTREEDIHEHWDVLDKEFGRIDVKAAKRMFRGGDIDHTIWWELKTVNRPPDWKPKKGWGVPNGIDRLIAVRGENAFYLIRPESIIDDLRERCTKYYRGEFGLYGREGRGDLTTILPLWYVEENAEVYLEV